jgi:hypothetical protein
VSLFNSLPVSVPPEDVRGIGIHVTRLSPHDHRQTPKAVPLRQLFPPSAAIRQQRQDSEGQRSDAPALSTPEPRLRTGPLRDERDSRSSSAYVIPSLSQIDQEVLTQLPEDVKQEIKRNLLPRPPQPVKRTRTLMTCFETNSSWGLARRGVGEVTSQKANRAVVAEDEVRSSFSLTQQVQSVSLLLSPHRCVRLTSWSTCQRNLWRKFGRRCVLSIGRSFETVPSLQTFLLLRCRRGKEKLLSRSRHPLRLKQEEEEQEQEVLRVGSRGAIALLSWRCFSQCGTGDGMRRLTISILCLLTLSGCSQRTNWTGYFFFQTSHADLPPPR